MKIKALPIYVYRQADGSDCTNNGISSRYDRLLCVCNDGFIDVDESDPPENLVKVVRRELFGRVIYHLEPVTRPTGVGWMAGGNYASSSDSRFSELVGEMYGAVSIHDRQETQEQYELLSR